MNTLISERLIFEESLALQSKCSLSSFLNGFPSMMTQDEKRMLVQMASTVYSGQGVIVDGGVWLGASTLCLAEGLKRRGLYTRRDGGKPIMSFDLAICDQHMATQINKIYNSNLNVNDSFSDFLSHNLLGVEELVDLYIGDIKDTAASVKYPVEIFFYDCGKTPEIDDFVVRNIFTKLIPGHSFLIQQDFFHEWLPWIKVSMGKLLDKFEYIASFGPSAVFALKNPIDFSDFASCSILDMDIEEANHHFSKCFNLSDDPGHTYILNLARAVLYGQMGNSAFALQLIDDLVRPNDSQSIIGYGLPYGEQIRTWLKAKESKN
jgi:hypothetical protein